MNKPITGLALRALATLGLATALPGLPAAHAEVDDIVAFTQAGKVDIILTGNAGGFDHILEPVMVGGNGLFGAGVPQFNDTPPDYPAAWIIGTENDSPFILVGDPGSPRSPTGFNYNWGYFDVLPGQEITLRLTNVWTDRIGGTDPDALGTIHSQLFSGSSKVNNTLFTGGSVAGNTPGAPDDGGLLGGGYTFVSFVSPTQIDIGFTDLFQDGSFTNMTVTLMLTPVPEPGTAALWLAGLAAMIWVAQRRRG